MTNDNKPQVKGVTALGGDVPRMLCVGFADGPQLVFLRDGRVELSHPEAVHHTVRNVAAALEPYLKELYGLEKGGSKHEPANRGLHEKDRS